MSTNATNYSATNISTTPASQQLANVANFNNPLVIAGAVVAVVGNVLISLSYQVIST
jgi:hypothetical protein